MDSRTDLETISAHILSLKKIALELKTLGDYIPCIARNTARVLASLKMLEIGFSDVADLESGDLEPQPRLAAAPAALTRRGASTVPVPSQENDKWTEKPSLPARES